MIRSYLTKIFRDALSSPMEETPRLVRGGPTMSAEEALYNTAPSHLIYQIANGFIVIRRNHHDVASVMSTLPVFCKTGDEIAEAVVSSAVKDKLNIGVAAVGAGGSGVKFNAPTMAQKASPY